MAEGSVRVNQSVYASLKRLVSDLADRRCRQCRRAVAQLQIAQLEPFKKGQPARVQRFGVFLPALIILLEQIEIGPSGEQRVHDGVQSARHHEPGKLTVLKRLRYLQAR